MTTYQSLLTERLQSRSVRQRADEEVRTALIQLNFLMSQKVLGENGTFKGETDVWQYQTAVDLGLVELTPPSTPLFGDEGVIYVRPTEHGHEVYNALQRESYNFTPKR